MVHGGSVKGKCKHHHNIGLVIGMHEPEQRPIGDSPDLGPRGEVVGKGGGCWVLVLGEVGRGDAVDEDGDLALGTTQRQRGRWRWL
ncbi:unnamed protein product [Prunus armeniaca]|uniref:Uncharacterized protein n=1 Tax=Prunus armeniaca TaxID=36596 RepID=A0A6J5TM75_PRUAR|nr:unnamed protein product [Prunus armeniaca]CAB4295352.1 unnamed protein product [Prunus armeniaca]